MKTDETKKLCIFTNENKNNISKGASVSLVLSQGYSPEMLIPQPWRQRRDGRWTSLINAQGLNEYTRGYEWWVCGIVTWTAGQTVIVVRHPRSITFQIKGNIHQFLKILGRPPFNRGFGQARKNERDGHPHHPHKSLNSVRNQSKTCRFKHTIRGKNLEILWPSLKQDSQVLNHRSFPRFRNFALSREKVPGENRLSPFHNRRWMQWISLNVTCSCLSETRSKRTRAGEYSPPQRRSITLLRRVIDAKWTEI